jgi:branched-subunit amino acid aminotransferase/4-amino-4-deoxychorismate lyase
LAEHNHGLLDPEDDLGLSVCVTPGPYLTMRDAVPAAARHGPLVCMHTYPLPFGLWADKYAQGQSLRVTDVRQVPTTCWPPELKCRSRMHYYLADLRARKMEPGARALLLDHDGYALEASTANIVVYREQEGFVSPPHEKILPGISVGVVAELAAGLGIPFRDRDLTVEDLFQADEVMLCSTSPCVWPVFRLNGRPLGQAGGGRICRRLLSDWSALAGVDIPAQAARFAQRRSHV